MGTHSEETKAFRKLDRHAKFESVLELCKKLGHIPRTYKSKRHNPNQAERVRAQFFINMQSAKNRNELHEDFHKYVDDISAYGNPHLDTDEKINRLYEFFVENKRLPAVKFNDDVSYIGNWKTVKDIDTSDVAGNGLSKLVNNRLKKMQKFATHIAPHTRIERLNILLQFCIKNNRTPAQHSADLSEKSLADFLSTMKQVSKKKKLPSDLALIMGQVMSFPSSREMRIRENTINR